MQFTAAIQVYFKRIMSKLTAKTSLQGDSMKDHQSKMSKNEAKVEGTHASRSSEERVQTVKGWSETGNLQSRGWQAVTDNFSAN